MMITYVLKILRRTIYILNIAALSCLALNISAQEFGNFPFEESLLGSSSSSIVKVGATQSSDGIVLTNNSQNQFGAIYVQDRKFSAINGIVVEFEYIMYGGSTGGDGLSMFLFDSNVTPAVGSHGAGLGYAYRWSSKDGYPSKGGLEGGYLGVGFDLYGNYRVVRFLDEERVSGIPFGGILTRENWGTNDGSHVTLRGAQGKAFSVRQPSGGTINFSSRYAGYPVLISKSTKNDVVYIQRDITGESDTGPGFRTETGKNHNFNINNTKNSDNTYEYRKAIVELFPASDTPEKGFYVTVKVQHGNQLDTLIYDYHYKESFYYHENAAKSNFANTYPSDDILIKKLDAKVPDFLKVGFAASTGTHGTNYHLIRNLTLTLPRAAEAVDDSVTIYKGRTADISPFVNDIAYSGVISRQQDGSSDNIDENSFRFIFNADTVKLNQGETMLEYPVSGVGKWIYNSIQKKVFFEPVSGFEGEAKIKYDIKGKRDPNPNAGPYHDEAYRSILARIVVNVVDNPNSNVISNQMVTIKLK